MLIGANEADLHHGSQMTNIERPFAEKLKSFLMEFAVMGDNNRKVFKYARQLTELAHRDQVSMHIDLDDLEEYDLELCHKVLRNAKRYILFLYEIVQAALPDYKTREVTAKDSLGMTSFSTTDNKSS